MKDFASYYDVLRISENVSEEEIKKAYRRLVLQFHPDRVSPEAPDLKDLAEEEFKRIQEAYDVLSEPGKRKKYDEQLKNLKAGQAASQGGAGAPPVVRVDKNYLQFANLKPGVSASDILTVFNDGGGALIGTVTADKPWVKFSETVINTSDYQEIEITIDTASLPVGFSDSALVEIDTSGGNETVAVDISLELSFLALFYAYLKPFSESFWAWALVTILSALFLISCLIYSCNRSPVISKTSQSQTTFRETRGLPKPAIPAEDVATYQTLFDKRGPVGYAPVVVEYLRKEEIENIPANEEQEIFYPKTGAFYPIKESRHPEFYKKCDLDGDGIITLYELGKTQYEFNRITAKYPEGDVDSIVKEFVSTRIH